MNSAGYKLLFCLGWLPRSFLISGNAAAALAGHYLKNFSVLPVFQGVVGILSPSWRELSRIKRLRQTVAEKLPNQAHHNCHGANLSQYKISQK
jgi:hypothetical protein